MTALNILLGLVAANCVLSFGIIAVWLWRSLFLKAQAKVAAPVYRTPPPPRPTRAAYPAPTGKHKPKVMDDYTAYQLEREHNEKRPPAY